MPAMADEGTPAPPWVEDDEGSAVEDDGFESGSDGNSGMPPPPPNHRPGPGGAPTSSSRPKKRKSTAAVDESVDSASPSGTVNGGGESSGQNKRKRVYRACEVCRRKKVRCDGEKPCRHCVSYGEQCHYFEVKDRSAYSKRYVESLETRLARLEQALNQAIVGGLQSAAPIMGTTGARPADTVEPITAPEQARLPGESAPSPPGGKPRDASAQSEADHRLKELAELSSMAALRQADGSGSAPSGPQQAMTEVPDGIDPQLVGEAQALAAEPQSGRLQYDENRNLRYIGPSATVTLVLDAHSALDGRLQENGAAQANLGWITSSLGVNFSRVLPSVESVTFPDRDLSDLLVRTFFDCIHPVFPVLDERDFNARYADMFTQASGSSQKADPLFVATLFAIFACASRIVQDPRVCPSSAEAHLWGYEARSGAASSSRKAGAPGRKETKANFALAGVQFFARSQLLALHRSMDTRIEQVQTRALLAYFMASSNCAARAWLIIGQALRMACDLGLHRNLSHLGLTYLELEIRKRVWWNIYLLDRILSVSLGRPLGIEDASVDQELPSLEFQPPFPLVEGFNAIVKLVRLSSDIAKNSFQKQQAKSKNDAVTAEHYHAQARKYAEDLATWFGAVPSHLKTGTHEVGSAPAQQSCVAFILFRSTTMLLQRSFLQGGLVSASRNSIGRSQEEESALAECYKTANTLIKAAPRIAATLPASPFLLEYAQQLLVAGGYLALNAWRWRGTAAAETHLQEASEAGLALHGLEPIFPSARALRRVLDSVIAKLRSRLAPTRSSSTQGVDVVIGDATSQQHLMNSSGHEAPSRSTGSVDQTAAPPFDAASWAGMLAASAHVQDMSPTASFSPGEGSSGGAGKPPGEFEFEGLDWLEAMFGGDAGDSLPGASTAAEATAPLWEI